MSKGGGGGTQTVTQEVPEWAKPFYLDLMDRAKATTEQPYQPYTGSRLAETPQDILTSREMVRGIASTPTPGIGESMNVIGGLGEQSFLLSGQPHSSFTQAGFSETEVSPFAGFEERGAQEFEFDPSRQFTGEEAEKYMSPYMEAVIGRQEEEAIRQSARQRAGRAAQAIGAGAFGGSRQAVQESLAEESLGRQLGDIRASGLQTAYEQAARQFESDRAAEMSLQQQRAAEAARVQGVGTSEAARVQQAIAAELARTQGISVDEASRVQAANASEMSRVQAARAEEAKFRSQFQLQAMGFSSDMAMALADLGQRARAGDIQAAQLLDAQGLSAMARDQAGLDIAYQDFLRQQQYPMEQLAAYSGLLRGLPVGPAVTSTTTYPQPSQAQQLLGTGISAYGLYRGLQ